MTLPGPRRTGDLVGALAAVAVVLVVVASGAPASSLSRLPSVGAADADGQPHVHDHWDGRAEATILDETVGTEWADRTLDSVWRPVNPRFSLDIPARVEGGEVVPNTVFPGTGEIEVQLSWTGQARGTPVVCVGVPLGRLGPPCTMEGTRHAFEQSGEVWTLSKANAPFPFDEATWDGPHQVRSQWFFRVWLCADDSAEAPCPADLGIESFRLTVTVHRGEEPLPVDPPHPDRFGDDPVRTVLDDATISSGPVQATYLGHTQAKVLGGEERAYWTISGFTLAHSYDSPFPHIPWDAEAVRVRLEWSSGTPADLAFMYKTKADSYLGSWRDASRYARSCSADCLDYVIPVEPWEADSPYAGYTQWLFGIFAGDDPARPMSAYDVRMSIAVEGRGV